MTCPPGAQPGRYLVRRPESPTPTSAAPPTCSSSDMAGIVRRYYKAELAIINIGDIFTMGPEEAAFAVNELIKPKAAIVAHAGV